MRKLRTSTLAQNFHPEFRGTLWDRTWSSKELVGPTVLSAVQQKRTYSGFGLRSPFAVYHKPGALASSTVCDGQTLFELFLKECLRKEESFIKVVLEQVLFGLHRYHLSQKMGIGCIGPQTVAVSSEGLAFVLCCPVAQVSNRFTPADQQSKFWEAPYRPPEFSSSEQPTVEGDLFSLGQILLKLFAPGLPDTLKPLAERAVATDPRERFQSALEMALAMNPDTQLPDLDIPGGRLQLKEGMTQFLGGRNEEAGKNWSEGTKKDWLSSSLWNNLAVSMMRRKEWGEALKTLEKARLLEPSHPKILCNIAFCKMCLRDLEAAEQLVNQVTAMRPNLIPALLLHSNLSLKRHHFDLAFSYVSEAILRDPHHRTARWQRLRVLKAQKRYEQAAEEREGLQKLPFRVPFADHLIDDFTEPPWGDIQNDWLPPTDYRTNEPPDDGPDDLGSGVPRRPKPRSPEGRAMIAPAGSGVSSKMQRR